MSGGDTAHESSHRVPSDVRVALVLTQTTEAEFVALVTLAKHSGTAPRVAVVVPALDVEATRAHVASLLGDDWGPVVVERIHDYLERGHDAALFVSDDAAERGRSLASAVQLLNGATTDLLDDPVSPSALVAWLAQQTTLRIPDALAPPPRRGRELVAPVSDDRVVLRTSWGGTLVCATATPVAEGLTLLGTYDPREVRTLEHTLQWGHDVIDASAGIGALAVRMAQLVGPRGRVTAVARDAEAYELLQQNLDLNGVAAWVQTATDWDCLDHVTRPVALLRVAETDVLEALERAATAIESAMIRALLIRLEPAALRGGADPIGQMLRHYRDALGATFGAVSLAGTIMPTTAERVLAADDPGAVLVELQGHR